MHGVGHRGRGSATPGEPQEAALSGRVLMAATRSRWWGGTQSFSASPQRALMGPRFRLSQRKDRIFIQMKPPLLALKGVSRNLWRTCPLPISPATALWLGDQDWQMGRELALFKPAAQALLQSTRTNHV